MSAFSKLKGMFGGMGDDEGHEHGEEGGCCGGEKREGEGKGLIPSLTGHDAAPTECNESKSTPSSAPHTAPMPDLD